MSKTIERPDHIIAYMRTVPSNQELPIVKPEIIQDYIDVYFILNSFFLTTSLFCITYFLYVLFKYDKVYTLNSLYIQKLFHEYLNSQERKDKEKLNKFYTLKYISRLHVNDYVIPTLIGIGVNLPVLYISSTSLIHLFISEKLFLYKVFSNPERALSRKTLSIDEIVLMVDNKSNDVLSLSGYFLNLMMTVGWTLFFFGIITAIFYSYHKKIKYILSPDGFLNFEYSDSGIYTGVESVMRSRVYRMLWISVTLLLMALFAYSHMYEYTSTLFSKKLYVLSTLFN